MEPLDLTAPARFRVEFTGGSDPDSLDYGGVLNLLGMVPGCERPCSLHPDYTINGDGCAQCWRIQRHRTESGSA